MSSSTQAPADPAVVTAEDLRQALADDYGQYEAGYQIKSRSGTLIYDTGHPVPASNVGDDGRVALSRHHCRAGDNSCAGTEKNHCDYFDEVDAWSEPGAAVAVERPAEVKKPRSAKAGDAGTGADKLAVSKE
jgi:hypothetical protein